MKSVKAVVLSDRCQYDAFVKSGSLLKDFSIFCDNATFYSFLKEKEVPFQPVDELLIRADWKSINAWGCDRAAGWIRFCREKGFFKEFDIPSVLYLFFSHLLVQALKNYSFAKLILEKEKIGEVVIFEGASLPIYPAFSGNQYLNYFLGLMASGRGIPVQKLLVLEGERGEGSSRLQGKPFQGLLRKVIQKLYGIGVRPSGPVDLLAHGSLRHLASVIQEAKKRDLKVALYDFEFHGEQFKFARKTKIPYWIPENFSKRSEAKIQNFAKAHWKELNLVFDLVASNGFFNYKGFDLGTFVRQFIVSSIKDYFPVLEKKASCYEALFETARARAVLTDEDYALRGGFFTAYARTKGLKTFCVSHADPSVDFQVSPEHQIFGQSITFVNSEYEKTMYAARGWDPSKLLVTGIPRYDKLLSIFNSRKAKPKDSRIRLLYCANSFLREKHRPNNHGYLGKHLRSHEGIVLPAARAILDAVRDLPVELVIKPHNVMGLPQWREWLAGENAPGTVSLLEDPNASFFECLATSDAMVLSYWSTALIEAALCRLPVFYTDFGLPSGPVVLNWEKVGFCTVAKDPQDLKNKLKQLCLSNAGFSAKKENEEYYLGRRDLGNTARVLDVIISNLNLQRQQKEAIR